MSRLVVFAGLPGSGKTTLARTCADRLGATFLRIDSIESAIAATLVQYVNNPVGYVVAWRIGADQLRAGRDVVIDAVNNVVEARDGWVNLAHETGATLRFVEVVCTDTDEHRRRIEDRRPDMPGHADPTWEQVQKRHYEPWTHDRLVIDNVGAPESHAATIDAYLGQRPS